MSFKHYIPLAMTFASMPGMGFRYVDKLEGIDIRKEYILIKEKRSSLSAAKRKMVIDRYEASHRGDNELAQMDN